MAKTRITVFAIDARDANWLAEYFAVAAVDGVGIVASHASSTPEWAKHDMGIGSDWKHDAYDEMYPDGWELEWGGVMADAEFCEYAEAHGMRKKVDE